MVSTTRFTSMYHISPQVGALFGTCSPLLNNRFCWYLRDIIPIIVIIYMPVYLSLFTLAQRSDNRCILPILSDFFWYSILTCTKVEVFVIWIPASQTTDLSTFFFLFAMQLTDNCQNRFFSKAKAQ